MLSVETHSMTSLCAKREIAAQRMDAAAWFERALHELKISDTKQRSDKTLVAKRPAVDCELRRVQYPRHCDVWIEVVQLATPAGLQQGIVNFLRS